MESLDEFTDGAVLSDVVTLVVSSIRRGKNEGPINADEHGLWAATHDEHVMWLVILPVSVFIVLATILAIIIALNGFAVAFPICEVAVRSREIAPLVAVLVCMLLVSSWCSPRCSGRWFRSREYPYAWQASSGIAEFQ